MLIKIYCIPYILLYAVHCFAIDISVRDIWLGITSPFYRLLYDYVSPNPPQPTAYKGMHLWVSLQTYMPIVYMQMTGNANGFPLGIRIYCSKPSISAHATDFILNLWSLSWYIVSNAKFQNITHVYTIWDDFNLERKKTRVLNNDLHRIYILVYNKVNTTHNLTTKYTYPFTYSYTTGPEYHHAINRYLTG